MTWIAAVAGGLQTLFQYERTPGRVGVTSAQWPSDSPVQRSEEKWTLIMLAHPHCPCTRASIGELARIMVHAQGKVKACVLFIKPDGAGADWDETELRRSAAAIPGVTVLTDANGTQAGRFGAQTSGHTMLFGRDGALVFSGGITASRGHAGDNAGESAILAAIGEEGGARRVATPVFGCSLTEQPQSGEKTICLK